MPQAERLAMAARYASKQMIESPNEWPRWPVLPVKQRTDMTIEPGILFGDPVPGNVKVHHCNMFAITECSEHEHSAYDSVDALLEAGWVVD